MMTELNATTSNATAPPRYFVTVFGDPPTCGNPVESGSYEGANNYPSFPVRQGDVILLYGTEGYAQYPREIAGIGIVLDVVRTSPEIIRYRWIPFAQPIPKSEIDKTFDPADQKKMSELRFNTRRCFEISKGSFDKLVGSRLTSWDRL